MHRRLGLRHGRRGRERARRHVLRVPVDRRRSRGDMIAGTHRDELRVRQLVAGTVGAAHPARGQRTPFDLVRGIGRVLCRERSGDEREQRQRSE
jgi:hypothetical protein